MRNQVPPGFGVEPHMAAVASQVRHIQELHIDLLQVGLHSLELGPHIQELVLHNLELLQGLDMLELHSQELHNPALELHKREAVASQGPVLVLHLRKKPIDLDVSDFSAASSESYFSYARSSTLEPCQSLGWSVGRSYF